MATSRAMRAMIWPFAVRRQARHWPQGTRQGVPNLSAMVMGKVQLMTSAPEDRPAQEGRRSARRAARTERVCFSVAALVRGFERLF